MLFTEGEPIKREDEEKLDDGKFLKIYKVFFSWL